MVNSGVVWAVRAIFFSSSYLIFLRHLGVEPIGLYLHF